LLCITKEGAMKLRQTIKNEIYESLDSTCFTAEDFKVVFGDSMIGKKLMDITFAHDDRFNFKVMQEGNWLYIVMRPGEIAEQDETEVASLDEVMGLLPKWAMEVRNELKADGTVFDGIDRLRDLISEQLGDQTDEEEFSVEEINLLRKKFSDLEKRVIQLEKDKIITEKQLVKFTSGIEKVSDDIEYYPKKTWLKTAPNKIVKLVVAIGTSKEGRKMIADGARKLLGLE